MYINKHNNGLSSVTVSCNPPGGGGKVRGGVVMLRWEEGGGEVGGMWVEGEAKVRGRWGEGEAKPPLLYPVYSPALACVAATLL